MLRYWIIVLTLLVSFSSFAQEENPPVSWTVNLPELVTPIILPDLNLAQIHAEDSINDLDKSRPWRYGIERVVQINTNDHGVWSSLENGGRVWRVAVKSPNAVNISFNFNAFRLPLGSRLHFYNDDRTDVSRTYSQFDNRSTNTFGSWLINGDTVWIEYYEPYFSSNSAILNISSIIHGYRMGAVNSFIEDGRGLNDSDDCNFDVNCGIGGDFDAKKQLLKKSVALLNLGNGFLCSAVLVNNTSQDKTPYILTANHCLDFSDPSLWSVRFNWISPNPICASESASTNLETNFTLSGATLRANNPASEFALAEMATPIPDFWNVVFAGWNNSDELPNYEVGIHHPKGDIMKICRDDSGAVKEEVNGADVWLIKGISAGNGDGWEIGTTESGSSGSPLFDQDGYLIGQLYGGLAGCDGTNTNAEYDVYGRFGVSWSQGSSPESRLSDWLDPLQTGESTIESLENILNIEENQLVGDLQILPNPASSIIEIRNNKYPNLRYQFYNLLGQEIRSGKFVNAINYINVESLPKGIYLLYLIDDDSKLDVTKKIIIDR